MAIPLYRPAHHEEAQSTDRMRAAGARAREAFSAVTRHAQSIREELDLLVLPVPSEAHEESPSKP